jgi:hypothetical protein
MSRPASPAFVRGGLVGLCAALVTAAAHAGAGGGVPTGSALILLLIVCATVGAAVGGIRLEGRHTHAFLVIGALCVGQALGHVTLTVGGGHHEHAGWLLTPPMLMLHVLAALALGLLISAVEYLYAVCASVLCWLRIFVGGRLRPEGRSWRPSNVVVARPVLLRAGLGMRAPPQVSVVSA